MPELRIDHIVMAVPDLDGAAAGFADRGLLSLPGGEHPAWGTANRIVPLGDGVYVELIAVVDAERAAGSDFGRAVASASAGGGRLAAWAVATDDIDAVAGRLGLEVGGGERRLPDGSHLSWRLAGVGAAIASGALPFFIQWDAGAMHPGDVPVSHLGGPYRIESIEVSGDAARLRDWLGANSLPLTVRPGPEALQAVTLRGAAERIALP